jgi:4-diphosphocytidyl-2-C-methyl-D-erythritol kinase
MQAIDLADDLEITPSSSLRFRCDDPELEGEENLVWQAATDLAASCGRLPLAEITLKKRIPVGTGLGGGSSDAASTLLALDKLWQLNLPFERLVEIGSRLGSDVPFFFWGGAALASGRGDIIEPVPAGTGVPATVIFPESTIQSKTARMYGHLGTSDFSDGGLTRRCLQNLMAGQLTDDLFYNVFQQIAIREFPDLENILSAVTHACGRRPHLTGAGPAMFLLPTSEGEHAAICRALQPHQARAYFVRTVGRFEKKATTVGVPDL